MGKLPFSSSENSQMIVLATVCDYVILTVNQVCSTDMCRLQLSLHRLEYH